MIYPQIIQARREKRKLLALLLDPDKCTEAQIEKLGTILKDFPPQLLLVGGSLISAPIAPLVEQLKKKFGQEVLLYPGSPTHLCPNVDAVLFLSMLSGRNPELLIGHHVVAAPYIRRHGIEPIATGYLLIDGGVSTSVEYISQTRPMPADKTDIICATAMAGEMLGMQLLYLDAGSGALNPIAPETLKAVRSCTSLPLMAGGGITTPELLQKAFAAGADVVVVGNVLEKDPLLLRELLTTTQNSSSL